MDEHAPAIIIFTRNRHYLVERQARFHADYPGQLIVVDATEQPAAGLRMPPRGLYLHRPGMSVMGRIATGVSAVESSSCLLCADDDYALPDALRRCGDAIAADPGVSYATGTTVHFHPGEPSPDRALPGDISEVLRELTGAETPNGRFRLLMSRNVFHGLYYGCIRTEVAMRVSKALSGVADEDGLIAEQLWPLLPVLFGRAIQVDRLLMCRRIHDRNYSAMAAHMASFDDLADWQGFGELRARLEQLAAQAGLDASSTAGVVESWRDFGAGTGRGKRCQRSVRLALSSIWGRRWRGLLKDVRVGLTPRAWFDARERAIVRNAALRMTFKCRAYPWDDADARAAYEQVMGFDMRCEREKSAAAPPTKA